MKPLRSNRPRPGPPSVGRWPRIAAALLALAPITLVPGAAQAQSSASYTLEESTLNAGGRPASGSFATSASFRLTSDAIGDAAFARGMASASYRADGSFLVAYTPPGEVTALLIAADRQTLTWDAEPSVGDYNLYRDVITNLTDLGYGSCAQQDVADETTTDPSLPPTGDGYFYLVTAENRLGEEGTKGQRSSGTERTGTACP